MIMSSHDILTLMPESEEHLQKCPKIMAVPRQLSFSAFLPKNTAPRDTLSLFGAPKNFQHPKILPEVLKNPNTIARRPTALLKFLVAHPRPLPTTDYNPSYVSHRQGSPEATNHHREDVVAGSVGCGCSPRGEEEEGCLDAANPFHCESGSSRTTKSHPLAIAHGGVYITHSCNFLCS